MAGGAGPSWLVLWGLHRHSWLVVWGPHCQWWCAGPLLPLVAGGVGPSNAICGAGHSSFFMGGGAGCSSHCSWMVVVALVMPFLGGGGAPLSVFMRRGAWPLSLSWWSCRHSRVRVVGGHSCLQTLHPLLSHIGVMSLSCIISVCCCRVSSPCCCPLPSSSLSHVIVVAVPSL